MIEFQFTALAKEFMRKLSSKDSERIFFKLKSLKNHPNIFSVIRRIRYFEPPKYRLRVGDQRLVMQIVENQKGNILFLIIKIGHRRDIYL